MKKMRRMVILTAAALLMLAGDLVPERWAPSGVDLIGEAYAVAGRQRRTRRRGVAVGYEAGKASASASQSSQQQQAAPQEEAAPQQQAATQPQAAPAQPAAAAPAGALPAGTIVSALPAGCTTSVVNGVEYFTDGTNYYRAAIQGGQVVYVTGAPS